MSNDLQEQFEFLDDLRKSGLVNMFGAAPHLQEQFGLTPKEARAVFTAWAKTFDGDADAAERSLRAISFF